MTTPDLVPYLILVGVPLILLGVALLRRGAWFHRTGDTPYCRACGYNLTGLAGSRCPECGADTSAKSAVVIGERHRRPHKVVAGVACLILGLYLSRQSINDPMTRVAWNACKPLWWLVRESDAGPTNAKNAAWSEINRRLEEGALSARQIDDLVEHALALQTGRPYATASERGYFDLLGERANRRALSPAQERRYVDGALRAGLTVRALVGSHDSVPFRVFGTGRGPSSGWSIRAKATVQVDGGRALEVGPIGVPESGQFDGWWFADSIRPQAPGKHHVRVTVEISSKSDRVLIPGPNERHATRVLEADFQSIDGQPPIATNTQPPITSIRSRGTMPGPAMWTPRIWVHVDGTVDVRLTSALTPPADAALDCLIRVGEQEYPCGLVTFHRGEYQAHEIRTRDVPQPLPPTVTLVLRGSADAARRTPDVTSTWVGDLVLPNVPVGGLGARRSRAAATSPFFRRPPAAPPGKG
jgi:hypothetical protein